MSAPMSFGVFRSFALDENLARLGSMLDDGFDVDAGNELGETVFMHCCANDRLVAAKFLLSRGADVNRSDHGGDTASDWAARNASRAFNAWLARAGGKRRDAVHY